MSDWRSDVCSSDLWPHNFNESPKEVFVRKDVYDTELQRIFHGEEWHPVCHESEIPERGDFKTFRLAGIPLLIARGDDGIFRAFFNACSHRWNQLETDRSEEQTSELQ